MPCEKMLDEKGRIVAIICYRGGKRARCAYCKNPSEVLCDGVTEYRNERAVTCDRPMCRKHAFHKEGKDKDFCHDHWLQMSKSVNVRLKTEGKIKVGFRPAHNAGAKHRKKKQSEK